MPAAECLLKSTCHILQSKTKPHIQQMLSLPLPTLPPEFHPVNTKAAKGQLPSHLAEARQLSSLSNFRGNCLFSITRQDKHFKELALIFLHYCSNLLTIIKCALLQSMVFITKEQSSLPLFAFVCVHTCMGKG